MDKQLETYYENRFSMFATQGWKDLIEDVRNMQLSTNDVMCIQDEKTLHFRRGELSIMRWLISLQEVSETAYKDLKDEGIGGFPV